jgi:rhodanese-related sulfurtransferase
MAIPAWLQRLFGHRRPGPLWVEVAELRRRLDDGERPLIIDVRGPDEFDGPLGHIAGAHNVPLPDLAASIPEFSGTAGPIVLVCLTDKRSALAAAQLSEAGIRDVAVLRGGIRAWRGE